MQPRCGVRHRRPVLPPFHPQALGQALCCMHFLSQLCTQAQEPPAQSTNAYIPARPSSKRHCARQATRNSPEAATRRLVVPVQAPFGIWQRILFLIFPEEIAFFRRLFLMQFFNLTTPLLPTLKNCRYGEAWHIVAATCQRAAAGRHARRQDRQYHS